MPMTVTGDDIQQWATRIDAAGYLPDLVRRLVLATTSPSSIEFRSDGGTRYSGWDGSLVCGNAESPFCPAGLSQWELSTEVAVKKKLDGDYKKRSGDPQANYIAVTARRYSKKLAWSAQKTADGTWASVRVFDADDLATWLSDAPAVSIWFEANHLGRPADDVSTLDDFLDAWSNQTSPPLPRALLLLGTERSTAARAVGDWVAGEPKRLTISGDTREEAQRFVASAILALPDGGHAASRTVVVRSERALRWAEKQRPSCVIVPTIDAASQVSSAQHHLALPTDREGARRSQIELGPVPFSLVEKELARLGVRDAARLARDSQGSIPALARLCGGLGVPHWAASPNRALLVLLLAGQWNPTCSADMEALTALSHSTVAELESICAALSRCADPPLRRHHETHGPTTWRWSSPKDAWSVLCSALTDSLLADFRDIAINVLSEEDPVFTLAKRDRFAAPIHGKVLTHSRALRSGLTQTLARLSLSDAMLSGATSTSGSALASGILRTLLQPAWLAWASLSRELPTVAEIAPEHFLEALSKSIDLGSDGVVRLFAEESDSSSPHTGLLWALERLGWARERMPRVALALARLAEQDPGGRMSNRPISSLANLLHPLRPSTNATTEERIQLLRKLRADYPAVAWTLNIRSAGVLSFGVVSDSARPEFLSESCEGHTVSRLEFEQFARALGDELIALAEKSEGRWAELVKIHRALQRVRELFFTDLERLVEAGQINDGEQRLWSALRTSLHSAYYAKGSTSDENVMQLQRLYEVLTPRDPELQVAWLFGRPVQVPEHFPNGWQDEGRRLLELRRDAVNALFASGGAAQLVGLCSRVTDPDDLGVVLARATFAGEIEDRVFNLDSEEWAAVRPGFFAVLAGERGDAWVESHLGRLLNANRIDEALESALFLPRKPATWDLLATLCPALRTAYWKSKSIPHPLDRIDAERFVSELVTAGAYSHGFDVAAHHPKDLSSGLLVRLLDALAGSPEEIKLVEQANWGAQQIFERLFQDESLEDDALAKLELLYLPWIEEPGTTQSLRIFRALQRQPELFAQVVGTIYLSDAELAAPVDAIDSKRQAVAQSAFTLLEAWNGYPGQDGEGPAAMQHQREWCTTVLALTERSGHSGPAERAIATVLARVPHGLDGVWPCDAARVLIEQRRERFCSALDAAQWALRGVWCKGIFEGGAQERAIAVLHRTGAARVRDSGEYPETAAFLDRVAQFWELQAKREDDGARDEKLEAGVDE